MSGITRSEYKMAAGISDCGVYRYWLSRTWDESLPTAVWIMLNPSTADGLQDDPTIRKCVAFARSWGMGSIDVRNLFNVRSPSPAVMKRHDEPIGPEGDLHIEIAASIAIGNRDNRLIAAWGTNGSHLNRDSEAVRQLRGVDVYCLGTTKDGHPRHPLYLAGDTPLVRFN